MQHYPSKPSSAHLIAAKVRRRRSGVVELRG
jgi:hypothetical protein